MSAQCEARRKFAAPKSLRRIQGGGGQGQTKSSSSQISILRRSPFQVFKLLFSEAVLFKAILSFALGDVWENCKSFMLYTPFASVQVCEVLLLLCMYAYCQNLTLFKIPEFCVHKGIVSRERYCKRMSRFLLSGCHNFARCSSSWHNLQAELHGTLNASQRYNWQRIDCTTVRCKSLIDSGLAAIA